MTYGQADSDAGDSLLGPLHRTVDAVIDMENLLSTFPASFLFFLIAFFSPDRVDRPSMIRVICQPAIRKKVVQFDAGHWLPRG